jgi:hypothetical protein
MNSFEKCLFLSFKFIFHNDSDIKDKINIIINNAKQDGISNIQLIKNEYNIISFIKNNKFIRMKIGKFLYEYCFFCNNRQQMTLSFISCLKLKNMSYFFEIVQGNEIKKWYLEDNYVFGHGTLNKSCMRYERTQKRINFYVNNSDVCKLLILKPNKESKQIIGRALLWDTNKGKYLDRIYTKNTNDEYLFKMYSKIFISNKILFYNKKHQRLKVKLKQKNIIKNIINYYKLKDPKNYPFMDTFKFYSLSNNTLYNYINYDNFIVLDNVP